MKTSSPLPWHMARAFSLVETTVALGLFALMVLPVFGLLTVGVAQSKAALHQGAMQSVRDTLRLRLGSEQGWPEEAAGPGWSAEVIFSRDGSQVREQEEPDAFVKVRMRATPASSFPGGTLEAVRCEFFRPREESSVASCVILRHRHP